MGLSDILILEREPITCPCYKCNQLAVLLRRNLPTSEIAVQTGNHISSGTTTSPSRGLIIFRFSFSERFLEVAQNLKAKWNAAYILGIICADSDVPARRDDLSSDCLANMAWTVQLSRGYTR